MADYYQGEVGFAVVTPAGVRSRIDTLDYAWRALAAIKAIPPLASTVAELGAWRSWRQEVLDSPSSQWFASGTLDELESWRRRYSVAYAREVANKSASPAAPQPESLDTDPSTGVSWGWFVAAAAGGAAIAALAAGWRR